MRYKRYERMRFRILFLVMVAAVELPAVDTIQAVAQDTTPAEVNRLLDLSLEELMELKVTSLAKKPVSLAKSPAALTVITAEEIRRSGLTTIPELLRLVPGVYVAQIDANKWAISSRGFNGRFANKLLVLIDGRTVYSPVFSGVYWNVQDMLLGDIERIEVIRGPGGSLWGANAVNGIVNIITKHAGDTQGGLAQAGAGDQERGLGALRYGGKLGENVHYRFSGKYFNRDNFVTAQEDDAHDQWHMVRGAFRLDWDASARDELILQGAIYDGEADETGNLSSLTPPSTFSTTDTTELSGGHALLRFTRHESDASEWAVQAYFDRAERLDDELGPIDVDTYDLDFQHRFSTGRRHELTWGVGYRRVEDDLPNTFTVSFDPPSRGTDLWSAFVQDEIILREDLRLTLGSKFEHNDYSGFEYQPSARMLWEMRPQHILWGAVSRAVRTPSRAESDFRVNTAASPGPELPVLVSILGNPDVESEELLAYELGYRGRLAPRMHLDLAVFYNDYDGLLGPSPTPPLVETIPAPPHLLIPQRFTNELEAESYGVELAARWQVTQTWRLTTAYSWLKANVHDEPPLPDTRALQSNHPRQQLQIHSYLDLPHHLELDMAAYAVDSLPVLDIPAYTRLDLRLGWRPRPALELSLSFYNLLDDRHPEFDNLDVVRSEIPRSLYGQIVWRF